MLRWKEIYIFIAHFVQFSARRNNFGAHDSNKKKKKSLFKKPSKLDKSQSNRHNSRLEFNKSCMLKPKNI